MRPLLKHQRPIFNIRWCRFGFRMPLKLFHYNTFIWCELYAFGGQCFISLVKEFRTAQRTVFEHNAMPRQMPTVFIIRCVTDKACHTRPPNHFCNLTKGRHPPRWNLCNNFINTFVKSFHSFSFIEIILYLATRCQESPCKTFGRVYNGTHRRYGRAG